MWTAHSTTSGGGTVVVEDEVQSVTRSIRTGSTGGRTTEEFTSVIKAHSDSGGANTSPAPDSPEVSHSMPILDGGEAKRENMKNYHELKIQYDQLQTEFVLLQSKHQREREGRETAERVSSHLQINFSETKRHSDEVQRQCRTATEQLYEERRNQSKARAMAIEAEMGRKEMERRWKDAQRENAAKKETIEHLKEELRNSNDRRAKLEQELISLNNSMRGLSVEREEGASERERVHIQLTTQTEQYNTLLSEHRKVTEAELASKRERERLQSDILNCQEELHRLRTDRTRAAELNEEIDTLRISKQKMVIELHNIQNDLQNQTALTNQAQSELSILKATMESEHARLEGSTEEVSALKEQIHALQSERNSLKAERERLAHTLETQLTNLRSQNRDLEARLEATTREYQQYQIKSESEMQVLKTSFETEHTRVIGTSEEVTNQRNMVKSLQMENLNLKSEMERERHTSESQINSLRSQIRDLENRLETSSRDHQQLQMRFHSLEQEKGQTEAKLGEITTLRMKITQIEEMKSLAVADRNQEVERLEMEIHTLRAEISQLRSAEQARNEMIEQLERSKANLMAEYSRLQTQSVSMEGREKKNYAELQEKVKHLETQLERMRRSYQDELNQSRKHSTDEVNSTKQELLMAKDEIQKLRVGQVSLTEYNARETELAKWQAELENERIIRHKLEEMVRELESEIDWMKNNTSTTTYTRTKQRPWVGVEIKMLDDAVTGKRDSVVVVNKVTEDSPAQRAGILNEDIIEMWEGERLWSKARWQERLEGAKVGSVVNFGLVRAGKRLTLPITIEGTFKAKKASHRVKSKTITTLTTSEVGSNQQQPPLHLHPQ